MVVIALLVIASEHSIVDVYAGFVNTTVSHTEHSLRCELWY